MLKINITGESQMIFRNEKDGRVFYNTSLSKKEQDGNWTNGNIQIQFKKDVDIPNQAKIDIQNAWLTFYKTQDGKTVPYIFCNEFIKVGDSKSAGNKYDGPAQAEFYPIDESIEDADLPF